MERLTEKLLGNSYPLKNKAYSKIGLFTDYDGFYAFFEAVNRLGKIEDILGDDYDLDRLRELAQADRDGRCLIPPCKVGDTIYRIHNSSIEKWKVCGIGAGNAHLDTLFDSEEDSNGIFVFVKNRRGSIRMKIPVERFGEVIFLTPEEAKVKLEGSAKDE